MVSERFEFRSWLAFADDGTSSTASASRVAISRFILGCCLSCCRYVFLIVSVEVLFVNTLKKFLSFGFGNQVTLPETRL